MKKIVLLIMGVILCLTIGACENKESVTNEEVYVYCGAGMKEPFQKIVDNFNTEYGGNILVTYGNAGQLQTQINTAKEGSFFVAGSKEELKPVEEMIESSVDLVQHIPAFAVEKGNPKNIQSISDLNKDIKIAIGDTEATPIGKIAVKFFEDNNIKDNVNIYVTMPTAPPIAEAVISKEVDCGIVWKENVNTEKLDIILENEMEKYKKIIPVATLSSKTGSEIEEKFLEYLMTEDVYKIWESYGYEGV